MTELKQGSTLKNGKYKIVKTLGQGSFGITYLAQTHVSMNGQLGKMDVTVNVAIKEFFMSDLNNRASDGTNVERTSSTLVKNYMRKFRREAENLAKLHHLNIVRVLEVFDENNTTYYVMEYVDGETIDDYIKAKGGLSETEALQITQDVCAALSYMHEHNMLHLDLKPKNIMRNSDGKIFLIDFGLAKQYTENGEPESSTTIGLGTPGYAPIEQAHYKGDGSLPVTLDIYALGASLFKMLTGKTPPDSSRVLNEGLPLSQLRSADVSDRTIAIVEKAMAPMKKERFQTIKELLQNVSHLYGDSEREETLIESIIQHDTNNGEKKTAPICSAPKRTSLASVQCTFPTASICVWLIGIIMSIASECLVYIPDTDYTGRLYNISFLGFILMLCKRIGGAILVFTSIVYFCYNCYYEFTSPNSRLLIMCGAASYTLLFIVSLFIEKTGKSTWEILYNNNQIPLLSLVIWCFGANILAFNCDDYLSYIIFSLNEEDENFLEFLINFMIVFMNLVGLVLMMFGKKIGLIVASISIIISLILDLKIDSFGFEATFAFAFIVSLFFRKNGISTYELFKKNIT